jgi:hypothetical protein
MVCSFAEQYSTYYTVPLSFYFVCHIQRWVPALFSRFRTKEKERQKSESAKRKRKKREFALFPPPTVEIRFQSPKLLGRGKARVLSKMYSSVGVLYLCPILAVIF